MTDQQLIAALLRERAALARRHLTDRIAEVDAQLVALGAVSPSDERATDETTIETPEARQPKPRRRRSAA